MKNEVLYLLLNNYADHEAVFLASAIACDERSIKENPKYMNKVVAPTLDVVRSCSGFHTLPDYSFETMPNDYAALVLIGGFGWFDELEADKVVPIVRRAIKKGIIVGAICNAASFLAKHGFLDEINQIAPEICEQCVLDAIETGYRLIDTAAAYMNEQAVSDKRIVTANGTGYLEFAKELLLLLENDTPEQIEMFYCFNKEGLVKLFSQLP